MGQYGRVLGHSSYQQQQEDQQMGQYGRVLRSYMPAIQGSQQPELVSCDDQLRQQQLHFAEQYSSVALDASSCQQQQEDQRMGQYGRALHSYMPAIQGSPQPELVSCDDQLRQQQ